MNSANYDVLIVGAGAAGLTAAIGLGRAGFAVAVVESAAYPGAENWSGCVYFCENLAHPDILGPAGVEELAWERRLVERGFFATDGHSLLGLTYRDPSAFRQCYTVLRPVYDHHLAQKALQLGVALLSDTTAESLIRAGDQVVGVCTQRGPVYADLVFLAEGDASHLVTREGYERFTDPREAPKFLQGIKQVIDLPPGLIEKTFGVGPEEGVAYEMLVRNGTLRGRNVHLNMGGFVYTNRQSLSVGLVLPIDNLHDHFGGDPNLLLEWFEGLPALAPWLKDGQRGVFGAKIIRGGGARDIPTLIDNGLAIGGAASAIGIDFPYPNFTGPATAMGLLLTQAACRIRAEHTGTGPRFTRDRLRRHYLEPLQQTHYWQDVEFLRRWPAYVKRSPVFFGRNLDLALGSAYVWTRPGTWFPTRWINWLRLLRVTTGPAHWPELRHDLRHLVRALRLGDVVDRPALGRLLLDSAVNGLRDLFGRPRANVPDAGQVRIVYTVEGGAQPTGSAPWLVRHWFRRFGPVLAAAARRVYTNDSMPLLDKLPGAIRLLVRQVSLPDLLGAAGLGLAAGATAVLFAAWDRTLRLFRRPPPGKPLRGLFRRYTRAARQTLDLTRVIGRAAQSWETRLGRLAYRTIKASHIHIMWPRSLADKNAVADAGLWHVCPAHVYEARETEGGQLQVIVNFENCIKCETCWRASDLVDWGRDGRHRFTYPVASAVVPRLLEAVAAAAGSRPTQPRAMDWWEPTRRALATHPVVDGEEAASLGKLRLLLDQLDRKLVQFDDALAEEPRHIDQARGEYLEMLARYAQQLATRSQEILREGGSATNVQLAPLVGALVAKTQERARRTWQQRYAWAAADGRQIRWHDLVGLRKALDVLAPAAVVTRADPVTPWIRTEHDADRVAAAMRECTARLDEVFPATAWREFERQAPLSTEQDATLRELIARIPALDVANLDATLHPPLRKALLAELGRRDPSLGYRVACHLWARDLTRLAAGTATRVPAVQPAIRESDWACFAIIDAIRITDAGWSGEALFVPAQGARTLVLLVRDHLVVVSLAESHPGLTIEPLATLGLRGAGLARLRLERFRLPESHTGVDPDRIRRVWSIQSAADLTSIAAGMADQLCRRAVGHAVSRVQFPGLFHDEAARDPIGKFGAVKKMIAEMEARRYLLETLDHSLSPVDFSAATLVQASLVKAVAAEALGTGPGSLAYNAGQVFGGTGYSEDDILSKYYRDAAAWRFLGPPNSEVFRRHGKELLRSWRPDGQQLAAVPDEADLFEQVAQRKALLAELDEVRNTRSRLRNLVGEWRAAAAPPPLAVPGQEGAAASGGESSCSAVGDADDGLASLAAAEVAEALARQDAQLLASKALLLRTHQRLERGLDAELPIALLRVWLDGAAMSLDAFEDDVRHWLDPAARQDDRPVVEVGAGPPVTVYADYLAAPGRSDSGDFLSNTVDLLEPRLVPEMIETDPRLAAVNRELRELLAGHFGPPRAGLPYERYVERQHRPDAADLDFCRRHGFFRMPIPKDLGGEARPKIDYYLLTTNAQRLADVAVSLTIQVNTSIGTTPILLARDKDLPKAQKDLAAFMGDPAIGQEIRAGLEELARLVAIPDLKTAEEVTRKLGQRLGETVLARPILRTLAHRFVEAWQGCVRAAKDFETEALIVHLEKAVAAWTDACGRAEELHSELGRRRTACDLFLRWIASGQISAFALTEPSAGSDTARVATRARLRSVPVEVEADGVLRFVPIGGKEPRYLLDAGRLEFRDNTAYYRWSEAAEPAAIHFDEYDYETDDHRRMRYYDHGGRRVHFTDIAHLRQRDERTWYDYWELTGAKMWITNGRMAGVMCLYAKTAEGVTGFLVDRHAEGLVVGKDEAKMGQHGSPTNELALQAVRVPRENVLGVEGRGQVNALETLNVGRAGLAMTAVTQMESLIHYSRAFAAGSLGEMSDWVRWRLRRMEEELFVAEALAFEIIGRFEHPRTKSVRMESAISKMLVSERLHRVIELAEEIHGLAGQTQLHLVEKRKRDARIINIYEGTNEIQRFFILKDLAGEVAARWSAPTGAPAHVGREAVTLEAVKAETRQRVRAALELFGRELWQNPNLQVNCFLLAEAAAWLKAADSALGRLAWLSRQNVPDETADPAPKLELAHSALARCFAEVRGRLRRFDEELAHLRRGFYAPEVRAASLAFDQSPEAAPPASFTGQVTRPLSVLIIPDPFTTDLPQPQVSDGCLLQGHLTWTAADRSALAMALQLRDQAAAPVAIQVAAVGPRAMAHALREALSCGVDRVRLVVARGDPVPPDRAAAALAAILETEPPFDLIVGGAGTGSGEEGLTARLTAAALGVPFAGMAEKLVVRFADRERNLALFDADGRHLRVRELPAAVAIKPGLTLRPFGIADYFSGLNRSVELIRWPKKLESRSALYLAGAGQEAQATPEQEPSPLRPEEAARQILREIGASGTPVALSSFEGAVEEVPGPSLLQTSRLAGGNVVAVVASAADGRLQPGASITLRAGRRVAETLGADLKVLLLAPDPENSWRRAVAQVLGEIRADVVVLATPAVVDSADLRGRFLADCWTELTVLPRVVIGEPWTEGAFIGLARPAGRTGAIALRVRSLEIEKDKIALETVRAGGRLMVRQTLDPKAGAPCCIALADDAEVEDEPAVFRNDAPRVQRWAPRREGFFGREDVRRLLDEVQRETGLARLADADFIIDVGFGVGNRDGYEAVIEPLIQALHGIGVKNLVVGGSRKVTEELHLLPVDRQIGQSGVSVNPQILLAIGVSGAPQHLNYIGPRATILAFNHDPESPLMTLNQRQSRPRVFPVVGDLFETVPALTRALGEEPTTKASLERCVSHAPTA
jgi:alkylation response protein AidB-like acyl-CoA dehydrogenase/flavin-dependent dehydrogenase/electron transfer flavoprotein alpha subunit/ferredoxin-like protein FixX